MSNFQLTNLIPSEKIEQGILVIRNQKVLLDHDLAKLYGVKTKRLNEQVKRNIKRFPTDFMFQLTPEEKNEVVAICDHLKNIKYSRVLPYAFTEHGAIMVATMLNTETTINMSVYIVRAFVKLRKLTLTHKDLVQKINSMEKKYDYQFKLAFNAIDGLMAPPTTKKHRIGFKAK